LTEFEPGHALIVPSRECQDNEGQFRQRYQRGSMDPPYRTPSLVTILVLTKADVLDSSRLGAGLHRMDSCISESSDRQYQYAGMVDSVHDVYRTGQRSGGCFIHACTETGSKDEPEKRTHGIQIRLDV